MTPQVHVTGVSRVENGFLVSSQILLLLLILRQLELSITTITQLIVYMKSFFLISFLRH